MKNPGAGVSTRYLAELRTHLSGNSSSNGDRAQGLGRDALAAGLVTRDLALLHDRALVALATDFDLTGRRNARRARARYFLIQALLPLEAAQRATRKSNRLLEQRVETLRLHTAALAAGNRRLQREVVRRKSGEAAIIRGKEQYQKLFEESQVMQRKLHRVTRQILTAQEDERELICRELHDEVVQTLVGINVQLASLGNSAAVRLEALKLKTAQIQRLVEKSVTAVHRFSRNLRPTVLDDLGLIPALHAYCRELAAEKKIKIELTAFAGVEELTSAKRIVLYRVAQEALTNVARHAHAKHVRVLLTALPGAVSLEISDDGRSFEVDKTLHARSPKRLGLVGMTERIEMVGGTMEISSAHGKGTTVRAQIPHRPKPSAK
ncbi:MAG: nreB [Verrucomicrobia bacterium]|nr:nreB [Verrucomicrobiota bacterium]